MLKQQAKKMADYRFIKYCVSLPFSDEVTLLFNTLTSEMLEIKNDELDQQNVCDELIRHWMLVPKDFEEKELTRQVISTALLMQNKHKENVSYYTIMTTTDCNARCFYCYEKGRSMIPMNTETALKTAEYIKKHSGDNAVELRWFGGEPLYNINVIDIICQKLCEYNIEYTSKIISNGYLFDNDIVKRAVDQWNLKSVQITLDGTENVYNQCKNYIYKDGSAYQRVIDNINKLLAAKVRVLVRLNLDLHNADDLLDLMDELNGCLENKENLNVYARPLIEKSTIEPYVRSEECRAEVYRKLFVLEEKIAKLGLEGKDGLRKRFMLNHCMADSGNSVVITPTGDITLCEYHSDDEFVGSIFSDELDADMIKSWKERCEDIPECADCPCYPECIRLKKCAEQVDCYKETREWKIRKIKQGMLNEYKRYLKKNNGETENDDWEDC